MRRTASTAPGTGADPCRMTPSISRRKAENRDVFAGMAVLYGRRRVVTAGLVPKSIFVPIAHAGWCRHTKV